MVSMTDYLNKIICGDALTVLKGMPDNLVHCAITSPPYWGLRDYGIEGQLGLEKTPDCGMQGFLRLRSDLSKAEIEFVFQQLQGGGYFDV